jgi:hypothetical protein
MFLIHGSYHWWPKRVGFRNDYCLSCEAPRRAIATRTFDVGHIFWVPLIPVGFWKHWSCTVCRRDPHARTKAPRTFKWIGLICLLILSAMFWTVPVDPEVSILAWILRIAPLAGAAALLFQVLLDSKEPSLRERLATIPPATDSACPFCATPLMAGERWSCPGCGVVRY